MRSPIFIRVLLCHWGRAGAISAADADKVTGLLAGARSAHLKKNLGEASRFYREALTLDPPGEPTAEQWELVRKFAPRLYTVAGEYFPLKDIVGILHPGRPIIAYHLFWEDDIGYPADNMPCDHEIVWITFDPATQAVTAVQTYFHGRILSSDAAVADANRQGGRAWIGVEWGFHGSVPLGALAEAGAKLREHWQLAQRGRAQPHPLARGWPTQYAARYEDFVNFAVLVDPIPLLAERKMVYVSRWADAVINQYCLRYNVAVKTEWPEPVKAGK